MNKKLALYVFKENRKLKREIKELKNLINEKCNFKELLTVKEACDYFGFSEKTFYRYRDMGLKIIQKGRNAKIYVKVIEVEKFLNK
ncbi:helix-turn-helix domain-containing protein [Chryseobacterium culicis]|uniref:helix-turn-helix domain-containing protein n=1 Tax=Chryseobacterium culicis TaxID=680127 RepID=UPI0018743935|nr:helix-turn-helix domain-containing protein [Chryseobacterium culicis]MBE4950723.1 helix-turn-helix domain-containing protein [Chryseobacterium culicis]